jgi:hypothetical protein
LAYWQLTLYATVLSRWQAHPKDFAHVDYFGENPGIALAQGLYVQGPTKILKDHRPRVGDAFVFDNEYQPQPLAMIHEIRLEKSEDCEFEDLYGRIYEPGDQDEYDLLLKSGMWLASQAKQLMVNQRRIYRFLEGIVDYILGDNNKYAEENTTHEQWIVSGPSQADREAGMGEDVSLGYVAFHQRILPYTYTTYPMIRGLGIITTQLRQCDYAVLLHILKADPEEFFACLCDVHEHSHYVLKNVDDSTHPWVSNCV